MDRSYPQDLDNVIWKRVIVVRVNSLPMNFQDRCSGRRQDLGMRMVEY